MALAWKAGKVQAFVGSNPTLSAGEPSAFSLQQARSQIVADG
jgi:hypothetical protein